MPYAYFLQCTLFPLPFLNEGGIYYLIGGFLLYALRPRRAVQLSVFTLTLGGLYALMLGQMNFSFIEVLTPGYEWMGLFAVGLMALYNGPDRAISVSSTGFIQPISICFIFCHA